MSIENKQAFEKKINKQMNQIISFRVMKVLLIIGIVVCIGIYGLNQLVIVMNYNPYKESEINEGDWSKSKDFNVLLETFLKMQYSGANFHVNDVKDLNFGNYLVDLSAVSYLHSPNTGATNAYMKISGSRVKELDFYYQSNMSLSLLIYEFDNPSTNSDNETHMIKDNTLRIMEELNQFPDSSYFDVSLSFRDYIDTNQLYSLMNTYDATIYWAAVENNQDRGIFGMAQGFSLIDNYGYDVIDKERYPNLIAFEYTSGEDIRDHYISQLQLLIDHPEFLKVMQTYYTSHIYPEYFQERLGSAKQEINIYGIRVVVGKQEFIHMLEDLDVSFVKIHDAKLSKYTQVN